jgi:cytochrome c biogenesis protein ResB
MNHPLRYEGDTFYQADILKGRNGTEKGTVLQVVRNPGFAMPYLSCAMVASGMLVHFGIHLFGFLRRRVV